MKLAARSAVVLLCALLSAASAAERTMRVKGSLHDYDDSPLNGNHLVHFRLDDPARERAVWSESIYVPVRRGVYSAVLGRHSELPLHYDSAAYRFSAKPPRKSGWLIGRIRGLIRRIFRPAPRPALKCKSPAGGFYVVEAGDTLQTVAEKLCGDSVNWVDLYLENYDRIQRAGDLTPGQVLLVPQIRLAPPEAAP